jgi:hypothetical protein
MASNNVDLTPHDHAQLRSICSVDVHPIPAQPPDAHFVARLSRTKGGWLATSRNRVRGSEHGIRYVCIVWLVLRRYRLVSIIARLTVGVTRRHPAFKFTAGVFELCV